jgi:hypothetical protein
MPHHRPALAVLLAIAAAGLTGCTTGPTTTPPPTTARSSTTAAATGTPTTAEPGPAVVQPATSEAAAVRDANTSLLGYYTASFQNGHSFGTRPELVAPWVTGAAAKNERTLATYLQQKHYRLDGTPTAWNLNPSRSSATRIKAVDGTANAFGSARLVGCATSTNHPVGKAAPAWTTKGQQFARAWNVLYDAALHRWLVAAAVELTDAEAEAVACP